MEIKNIVSLQDQVLKATFLSISHISKYLKVLKHIILKSEKSHEEECVRKVLHGVRQIVALKTCFEYGHACKYGQIYMAQAIF